MYFSHLSHLSWSSPCAGPASFFVIQYFRSCAMSSVSWYFLMSPFRFPSISFSVGLCSYSQKPLVSAISHRCGCVLASSRGQTALVFGFLGMFQQVLRVLPSWCLHFWCGPTWSSLSPMSSANIIAQGGSFSMFSVRTSISTINLAACVCVCQCVCQCAKFDQFLPGRSHFDSKRPEIFVRISTFPSATFGPLFAFHCPLFFLRKTII